MTTFAARMAPALAHELAVIERFNSTGWRAFPFGQSQLPDECRDLLRRYEDGSMRPCLIRWMPDVIAFRPMHSGRTHVVLVDAKVCGDRPNYSVEMSAAETAEAFTDRLYTPTFFVFDDWRVMTPREVRQRGRTGPNRNNGSGTPYYLIEKGFSRPFNKVFPPVQEVC